MSPGESQPWAWHRWVYTTLGLFAVQVGLVWLMSESTPHPKASPTWPTAIHLAADPWAAKQVLEWPGLEDPTLFALPHQHGFSGGAWLRYEPMSYEQKDWTEPPAWLRVDQTQLGGGFRQLMSSNLWPPVLIADRPMPRSVIPDFARLDLPMPSGSSWRLEGELASRRLVEPPALQAWAHTELLTNSVVQLIVDEQGYTFSTRLLGTSGLSAADQYALDLAAHAHFEPVAAEGKKASRFTWGKMVFQWQTLQAPVTNASPPLDFFP
jgi:hypothetical protein